jgi:hypothetical protein
MRERIATSFRQLADWIDPPKPPKTIPEWCQRFEWKAFAFALYLEGWTLAEIGEVIDRSPTTARKWISVTARELGIELTWLSWLRDNSKEARALLEERK